jgi:hypothetical protein
MGCVRCQQKRAGKSAAAIELECPEILIAVAVGNVRIFSFPLRQSEEILPGYPALLRPIATVGPLLPGKAFPLNFRHSTAENERTELVNHLILPTRIVIREVCFQFPEKLSLAPFLPFEAQAHEGGDRLTHAWVGGSRVAGNVVCNSRG